MRTFPLFRLHSFLGIITGGLLFIIVWSGSFAVLAQELDWLATPALRVTPQAEALSWQQLQQAAQTYAPDDQISSISAPLYSRAAAVVWLMRPDYSYYQIWLNPYTGAVQGESSLYDVQHFLRELHRRLFYPEPWGLYAVTLFAFSLFTSLMSALLFYKRWWRRFFVFEAGRGEKRSFWRGLHKLIGLWSIWFILLISLTGAWYLFEALRGQVGDGKLAYAGYPSFAVRTIPKPSSNPEQAALPLDELIAIAQQQRPDLNIRTVAFNWSHRGIVYVDGQARDWLARDRLNQVQLDARSGEILYAQSGASLPAYWRWSDLADPLHFGSFAGLWSKLMWFVVGLMLSGLILSGVYLHIKRLQQASAARHRWAGTKLALLLSGLVCLGSVPFALQQARAFYGPIVDGVRQYPNLEFGVAVVIVIWLVVTMGILGSWARALWRA